VAGLAVSEEEVIRHGEDEGSHNADDTFGGDGGELAPLHHFTEGFAEGQGYLKSALPKLEEYCQGLTDEMKQDCSDLLKKLRDSVDRLQEEL
jgi:hypothetical protein